MNRTIAKEGHSSISLDIKGALVDSGVRILAALDVLKALSQDVREEFFRSYDLVLPL
jgi:hypothetical protein